MSRAATLGVLAKIAACAERAADRTDKSREYSELRDCIIRGEKEHRAFGKRLVGPSAVKGRFTFEQAADYFVCRILADAASAQHDPRERSIRTLVGLREDYVRGAILFADDRFRAAFLAEIAKAFPNKPIPNLDDWTHALTVLRSQAESVDYSDLVEGK